MTQPPANQRDAVTNFLKLNPLRRPVAFALARFIFLSERTFRHENELFAGDCFFNSLFENGDAPFQSHNFCRQPDHGLAVRIATKCTDGRIDFGAPARIQTRQYITQISLTHRCRIPSSRSKATRARRNNLPIATAIKRLSLVPSRSPPNCTARSYSAGPASIEYS